MLQRGTPGGRDGKKMRRGLREEGTRARGRGRGRVNTYASPEAQGSLVARMGCIQGHQGVLEDLEVKSMSSSVKKAL